MKKQLLLGALLATALGLNAQTLTKIGSIKLGGEGAAEILAFDDQNNRLWVLNNPAQTVVVYDISDPSMPDSIGSVDFLPYGAGVNSIAIANGVVALAVEAEVKQDAGKAVFFDATNYRYLGDVPAGALPDMCIFTNDGTRLLVANEGEPNDDYSVDPEGSVTIVDGISNRNFTATQISFANLSPLQLSDGYKYASPNNASFAQDLEPEYIAVSDNDSLAFVTCQESNAMVLIDLVRNQATNAFGLGVKDYSLPGNGLDASDRNEEINITNWPVKGLYQPDAIAFFDGFIFTANEGDARDYDGYSEEVRIKNLVLDSVAFPNAAELQRDENIGRLRATDAVGDLDGDGDFDELYIYGARSFSVFNQSGALVYDSGDAFEQYIAANFPDFFNGQGEEGEFSRKNRSDDKGPEPEGLAIAKLEQSTLLFIGLERFGGIMIYDISSPVNPVFIDYINTYDFNTFTGDISPEGLSFLKTGPNTGILGVSYEVSGTVALFRVNAPVSVGEIDKNIQVYPNPSANIFRFSQALSGQIFNAAGAKIMDLNQVMEADLSGFVKGIYVLKAEGAAAKLLMRN